MRPHLQETIHTQVLYNIYIVYKLSQGVHGFPPKDLNLNIKKCIKKRLKKFNLVYLFVPSIQHMAKQRVGTQ